MLVVANFPEQEQMVVSYVVWDQWLPGVQIDLQSREVVPQKGVALASYQVLFLEPTLKIKIHKCRLGMSRWKDI